MTRFYPFLLIFGLLTLSACQPAVEEPAQSSERHVLVTIAPYRSFAVRLIEDSAVITVLVPPGANMHFFEPSPKQALAAAQSDLWFRIGEPVEKQVFNAIKQQRPEAQVINLADNLDLIHSDHGHHDGHHHDYDTHFWLSPRRMVTQVQRMAEELSKAYPEQKAVIAERARDLIDELKTLDLRIETILDYAKTKTVLVSHPAYSYFCKDYGLEQISIEREGQDPTPQALTKLVQLAREKQIKRVFVQPQHSSKGAVQVADAIGAEIIELDPYALDYFDNMRQMAWKLAGY